MPIDQIENNEIGSSVRAKLNSVIDLVNGLVAGTLAIGSGASEGSVTGLDLDDVPTAVLLTVQSPTDSEGSNVVATLLGAPTTDGFDFSLTLTTPSADYVLHYLVIL